MWHANTASVYQALEVDQHSTNEYTDLSKANFKWTNVPTAYHLSNQTGA